MNRQANRAARRLFLEAVERYSPSQWLAYLDRCCPDHEVRRAVERLLRAHERQSSWLDRADGSGPIRPGTLVGNYRLLEELGEGGFGIVYRAEQLEPIRRQVALKIIKPGMDTRQVVRRFRAEQQLLALMNHPGIAGVLDAGTTDRGYPYFVMELVPGQPLTEYCDDRRLSLTQRLELFANVCDAVQHAHEKGIVHRDLKPRNILVQDQEDRPQVKVIDFGVAKALHQRLGDQSVRTYSSQLLGTPLYMSPEQARGSGADVDTRSDVYSLSVVLYELLTGTTPFDKKQISRASPLQVPDLLHISDPSMPSRQFATLDTQSSSTVAEQRALTPRQLTLGLRGELDWIIMKGLDKDPRGRYETARGLGDDIRRHLRNEPIDASPPSLVYRFKRWVRHSHRRQALRIAVGAALILILFSGWLLLRWRESQQQLARMHNLSHLAAEQSRQHDFEQAEQNYRKLVVLQSRLLEDNADATLTSLYHVLELMHAQRRWAEAYPIVERIYSHDVHVGNMEKRSRERLMYMSYGSCLACCWDSLKPEIAYDGATIDQAISHANRCLAIKSDLDNVPLGSPTQSIRLWYMLGWCHALRGDTDDVEAAIGRMVAIDGDRLCRFLLRSILYHRLGKVELAEAAFLVGRDCLPRSASTYERWLPFDERYEESLQRVATLIGIHPHVHSSADSDGRLARAYRLMLQEYPQDPVLRFGNGLILARMGDWQQAEGEFATAAVTDRRDFRYWQAQAVAALQNHGAERFRKTCQQAYVRFRHTQDLGRLLLLCALSDNVPIPSMELQRQAERDWRGSSPAVALVRGVVLYRGGAYREAIELLPGKGDDHTSMMGDAFRALCLLNLGDRAVAERLIEQVQQRAAEITVHGTRTRLDLDSPEPPLDRAILDILFAEIAKSPIHGESSGIAFTGNHKVSPP